MAAFPSVKASQYFFATLRESPQEATIISHKLMLKAGLVQQIASGIYGWLPMGLRVLKKIEGIVREEQNKAGCTEILAPILQPSSLWQKSGRYDDYGKEMLRVMDRHERELLFGPTAEEVFTEIFRTHIHSYRQLPQRLYNIQWKFRDEIRPRFGVMRGREFLMKDTYSFDLTEEEAKISYKAVADSYLRTFARMNMRALPVRASTGPIGGDLSHEFHIIATVGESQLYYDKSIDTLPGQSLEEFVPYYAMADDQHIPHRCPLGPDQLGTARGIEVGHCFYFGTKYSEAMAATITLPSGQKIPAEMGSYGIGVSRLVGAIIEIFYDEAGISWPMSVAPFSVAVLALGSQEPVTTMAEQCWNDLQNLGIDVLYDDRNLTPGEKFAEADLLGYPYQVFISLRTLENQVVEVKHRPTGERTFLPWADTLNFLAQRCLALPQGC